MNDLLTVEELSKRINVKKSTIYLWTHLDYIPHIKIGRLVRFDWDDVENWLETKKESPRTEQMFLHRI